MDNKFFDMLLEGLEEAKGRKHDTSSTTPTTNMMHGPDGIFGYPGIEMDVFASRVKPAGLLSNIPAMPSQDTNPIVAYLTGFTDDASSTEKSGVCDTPIEAGETKSCLQGALFGRYERKSDVLELNATGRRTNRGEFMDLRLVNDPLLDSGFSVPGSVPASQATNLNREVLMRWINMGVSFERKLGPQIYSANPSNNTSGGYAEFHGLETLVGTGKVDVITGDTCPALDSYIRDFNYARVDTASDDLVAHLTYMWRYVNDIASRTGLAPVDFRFIMRRNLFVELADIWPCAYNTHRCGVENANTNRVFVDGAEQRRFADELRNGQFLLIDGVQVPVIIDDYIPEETDTTSANVDAGEFASDIYLLPFVVRGGIVSLFMEYFDYSGQGAAVQSAADGRVSSEYWTDGGRFLWTSQKTGWCVEWWAKIEPRLRLLTPHLAGRLQNVAYMPLVHFREDVPGSDYFFDGGVTTRTNEPYDADDFPAAS